MPRPKRIKDIIVKLQQPELRSEVVQEYREAGMGGERYGVSCPRCWLRICPQGYEDAKLHPDRFCQCEDMYQNEHEDIFSILERHGLPSGRGYLLRPVTNMSEATRKGKKPSKKS